MPALNYKKQFANAVQNFEKLSTIRRSGKRLPPKKGEHIKHYTGMMTKFCRLLCIGVCTEVTPIRIAYLDGKPTVFLGVVVRDEKSWVQVVPDEIEKLAKADGFESLDDFFAFFLTETDEFLGFLIEWEPKP